MVWYGTISLYEIGINVNQLCSEIDNNNYLLYGGESKCGGIILPYFTLGTSGFNLKPKGPQGPRALNWTHECPELSTVTLSHRITLTPK